MKLKEIDRQGRAAWAPKKLWNEDSFSEISNGGTFLAVGTASQRPDSSFSTNAHLEIFEFIPSQNSLEMPVCASIPSETKFSKLLWGNAENSNGFIVGGAENGAISIYDVNQLLLNGKSNKVDSSRVAIKMEHKGAVNAMDFNKFKPNLLATGSSDSDIYIWDLDKLEEPMTPGNKTQPLEDILSLAWNHKVQHILASTSSHRCQIWDLRKSDPVIKLSDSQMKMKCKKVVWHPDISTRLCISSEDDHTPIIQLWDLRYIQCPFHTLQKHSKGIVDIEWCLDDPDILMSVGKDRQMICWNMSTHNLSSTPNSSSDVIYEWQLDQEWINEANFCPKHPGLVSISSSDCHIGIYSLLGGRGHVPRELSDTMIDSFPLDLCNDDGQESEIIKKEVEKAAELQLSPTPSLSKAPKWLKRPIGARFSFGGQLVQFYKAEDSRSRNNSESQMSSSTATNDCKYKVFISQTITDKNLINDSKLLIAAMESSDTLLSYCHDKVESITNHLVDLDSGNKKSDLIFDRNIWKFIECHLEEDSRSAFMNNLGYSESNFKNIEKMSKINHNMLLENDEIVDQFTGQHVLTEMSLRDLDLLPEANDTEKLLSIALMTGNIDAAIDICFQENRSGEAVILAVSSGREDLYEKVQNRILNAASKKYLTTPLIYIAVKRNWLDLVEKCDLKDWKEALTWLLTYVSAEELTDLCEILAHRLEEKSKEDNEYLFAACICYICSGSIDNFVRCWLYCKSVKSNKDLKKLVEMIILLCKSIGDEDLSLIKGEALNMLIKFANLIASQGDMITALSYLGENEEASVLNLKYRICENLRDHLPSEIKMPQVPFKVSNIINIMTRNPNNLLQNQSFSKPHQRELNTSGFKVPDMQMPPSPQHMKFNEISNNTGKLNLISNDRLSKNMPPMSNNYQTNSFPSSSLTSSNNFIRSSPIFVPPIAGQFEKHQNTFISSEITSQGSNVTAKMSSNPQPNNIQSLSGSHPKSSWNDPPLLSENYRRMHIQNKIASNNYELSKTKVNKNTDMDKSDSEITQQYYNPSNFISESADLSALGSKLYSTSNTMISHVQSVNMKPTASITNQGMSEVKNTVGLSSDKQHWKTSLDNLIELCKEKDNSRQTKVKMEEIQRKLDHMFDILKTQTLSIELSTGLEALIVLINSKNYRESLNKVNQIIQTVNFSEAGSFLPSLKMLIQCVIRVVG